MNSWQRKGYMSKQHYDAACATTRKIKNKILDGTKAKYAHKDVLREMMDRGEYDRPVVTITRPQIQKKLGLDRKTVLAAYRILKDEGTIEAIYNTLGGRGNATTYLFRPPKFPKKTKVEADKIERTRVANEKAAKVMRDFVDEQT